MLLYAADLNVVNASIDIYWLIARRGVKQHYPKPVSLSSRLKVRSDRMRVARRAVTQRPFSL